MPKAPDPKRKEAMELFIKHDGKIANREISRVLDINEKSVSAWKSKDNWNGVLRKNNGENTEYSEKTTKKNGGAINKKKKEVVPKKRSGNPNPKNQFTVRNTAGKKHGLFMKYLPPGMHDLIDDIESSTVLDHLWTQITITFANILRSQEIIWVEDSEHHIKEVEKSFIGGRETDFGDESEEDVEKSFVGGRETDFGDESEEDVESILPGEYQYKVALAHERQEALIKAQSRAMGEYRNLVKQYMALAGEDDERALKLQTMQVDLDIKSANLAALTKENEGNDVNVVIVDEWRNE